MRFCHRQLNWFVGFVATAAASTKFGALESLNEYVMSSIDFVTVSIELPHTTKLCLAVYFCANI